MVRLEMFGLEKNTVRMDSGLVGLVESHGAHSVPSKPPLCLAWPLWIQCCSVSGFEISRCAGKKEYSWPNLTSNELPDEVIDDPTLLV